MIKTLNLNGTASVIIDAAHAHIRNDSADTRVCVATHPDPIEGEDGVLIIPPGQAAALYNCTGEIYLDGIGPVVIVSSNYAVSPFKCAPAMTGNGGGGSVLPVEPVLRAGSVGYFVQSQHYLNVTDGVYNSSERQLIFVSQDFESLDGYVLPDNPLDAAIDYSGILRLDCNYPYPEQLEVRTTNGETVIQPENHEFWLWTGGESNIETYLNPDALAGKTPFPPVQLDKVTPQGAYLWFYGNVNSSGANTTKPVIMLTVDIELPCVPPNAKE